MNGQHARTIALIGEEAWGRVRRAHVLIVGLGGVGGHAVEALARAGVGMLTLVDHDTVELSNLNRQLVATHETLGLYKADVLAQRIQAIDPGIITIPRRTFMSQDNLDSLMDPRPDVVIDAIDTISSKICLTVYCLKQGIPVYSSMGAGNRLDPSQLRYGELYETQNDPMARVMRRELRKRGVTALPVVYSTELPHRIVTASNHGRNSPASISFVPSVAGLMLAGAAVNLLIEGRMPDA